MSCLYALIFLSNFDHTHSFTLSPTWLFYVHSWYDFMPCVTPVLDCLIYFSHLSIWGHHKKGENELDYYGGFLKFWEYHLKLIYMLIFISFQTRYVTWYFLCLMCVGTSFDNPILHTLMRKAVRFLKIRRTNDAALVICTTFSFWVHGRVDLYRHFLVVW